MEIASKLDKTILLMVSMTDFDDTLLKAGLEAQPIPLGSGIAGHVALTKTGLRIVDAYRVNNVLIYCVASSCMCARILNATDFR